MALVIFFVDTSSSFDSYMPPILFDLFFFFNNKEKINWQKKTFG